MGTINLRYKGKERLVNEAKEKGFSSLTKYIIHIIEQRDHATIKKKPELVRSCNPGKRTETRLNEAEKNKLVAYCQSEGESESQVLLRQIRILLNNEPHFTGDEVLALRKATQELTVISRNLSQLVASINAGKVTDVNFTVNYAKQLKGYIDQQNEQILLLIKKSKNRVVTDG